MPAILNHIPQEILAHICSWLDPSESETSSDNSMKRRTLAALMRVSAAFARPALSMLYKSLDLAPELHNAGGLSLYGVLETCAKHPETIDAVREVRVGNQSPLRPNAPKTTLPNAGLPFAPLIERIDVPSTLRKKLQTGVQKGSQDALLAVLLGLCKNLTTLQISSTGMDGSLTEAFIVAAAFRHASSPNDSSNVTNRAVDLLGQLHNVCTQQQDPSATGELPLKRLRHARIDHSDSPRDAVRLFEALLQLPSLATLSGSMIKYVKGNKPMPPSLSSSVQTLNLCEAQIDPDSLDELLSCCPHVRELNIKWSGRDSRFERRHSFSDIGDVLRRRGSRLHTIRLLTSRFEPSEADVLGSLKSLSQLQVLHVTWDMIYASVYDRADNFLSSRSVTHLTDMLPTSLRELRILQPMEPFGLVYFGDELENQFQALMSSEDFPHLGAIWRSVKRAYAPTDHVPAGWHATAWEDNDGPYGYPNVVYKRDNRTNTDLAMEPTGYRWFDYAMDA